MDNQRAHHTIQTSDGQSLDGASYLPIGKEPTAIVICAHAMMVDMRTFAKSGFADYLVRSGFGVMLFNFRGRGQSKISDWSYDDLVQRDVPGVIKHVRGLFPNMPLIWLGHSLGGHVGLAAKACGHLTQISGLILISTNVWLPKLESSRWRRFKKEFGMRTARLYLQVFRTLPIVASGFGTVDEAPTYLKNLIDWWEEDVWRGETIDDYLTALQGLETPLISVVGEADRLEAHPDAARAFLNAFGPKHSTFLVASANWAQGETLCNHMNVITSPNCATGWQILCNWIEQLLERE